MLRLPREHDRVVFCDVLVAPQVLVGVPTGVVIVRYKRERPSCQDVLAAEDHNKPSAPVSIRQDDFVPDRVIAASVGHACSIPVFCDVAVDVLHEEIRSQNSVNEISTDVSIIKIILE